mgnify:CR=1 FL=1
MYCVAAACGGDVMKMSVDDTTSSKAGSNLTVSMESVSGHGTYHHIIVLSLIHVKALCYTEDKMFQALVGFCFVGIFTYAMH